MQKAKLISELKDLISASTILQENEKNVYLLMLNYLPEARLQELHGIFSDSARKEKEIQEKELDQKKQINKTYLAKTERFIPKILKKSIAKYEKDEKKNSEAILQKLNNI